MNEKKAIEEIKPCPFCGGEARFRVSENRSAHFGVGFTFFVECTKCGAKYPKRYECLFYMDGNGTINARTDERAQAIDDWNRRE